MTMITSSIFFFIVYVQCSYSINQCQDINGHKVDWWFARRNHKTRVFKYFDSSMELTNKRNRAVRPKKDFVDWEEFNFATPFNPILRSLDPIRREANNRRLELVHAVIPPAAVLPAATLGYIAYNDQSVQVTNSRYAHAKGFISWNIANNTGQWLIHSQPGWPYFEYPVASEYCADYDNGNNNPGFRQCSIARAQSFLCMSLKSPDELKQALKQIKAMNVFIYEKNGAEPAPNAQVAANPASFHGGNMKHFYNGDGDRAFAKIYQEYGGVHTQWFFSENQSPNGHEHSKIGFNKNPMATKDGFKGRKRIRVDVFPHNKAVVCVGDLNKKHHKNGARNGGFVCFEAKRLHFLIQNQYSIYIRDGGWWKAVDAIDENVYLDTDDVEDAVHEHALSFTFGELCAAFGFGFISSLFCSAVALIIGFTCYKNKELYLGDNTQYGIDNR
eukprot:373330_1